MTRSWCSSCWRSPRHWRSDRFSPSADGQKLDRLPLAQFGTHTYANNGYTLTVTAVGGAVSVTQSDCPGQDCVHSGAVSRAGQSIVCLPARIVVELVGAADGYDLVTG